MSSSGSPLALFIIGPPAVGKMTVGTVIAQRTGLRLFHNHQTIDLVLPFFSHWVEAIQTTGGSIQNRHF